MDLDRLSVSEWENALPESGIEVFHRADVLEVIDNHASGELYLFAGRNGRETVGLFPVFVRQQSFITSVTSPPAGFGIQRMGPVVMPNSPKRRKREQINRTFVEQVLAALAVGDRTTLFRTTTSPRYTDPRPFLWGGLSVKPRFTYRLNLRDVTPDEILKSFSKSLRRGIRDARDSGITVRTAGETAARKVYEITRNRFKEQGIGFPMTWEFKRDLLAVLGDDARVYAAETDDGEFLGGITVLYSDDTAYFWKGGTRRTFKGMSVNNIVHWQIIKDIITDPALDAVDTFDLYEANNERLSKYKSKFNGELRPYYAIESAGIPMTLAKKAYRIAAFDEELLYWKRGG